MKLTKDKFPANMKERRQGLGLTLGQAAGRTESIALPTWSTYESGRIEPGLSKLVEIANALECGVDALLTGAFDGQAKANKANAKPSKNGGSLGTRATVQKPKRISKG